MGFLNTITITISIFTITITSFIVLILYFNQDAPVVSSTPEVVKRGGSTTADLSCTVLAEPQAEVTTYK